MIMKIPNSSGNFYGYAGGDSYDSDPDDYSTPPNEEELLANYEGDFSEYLWMEDEDEFDKQEMERLEQEALMEQCIEAMLEDELEEQEAARESQNSELSNVLSSLQISKNNADIEKSTLNPMAAEFVPPPHLVAPTKT